METGVEGGVAGGVPEGAKGGLVGGVLGGVLGGGTMELRYLAKSSIVFVLFCILMLFHCGPKQDKVERTIENGVEVVINHLKPYQIRGEPFNLSLEKEFTIDLEKDEIANIGLTDSLAGVDVDSVGNIFLFQYPSGGRNIVFKFDRNGKFVTSFGLRGQGPGEVNFAWHIRVSNQDKIVITGPADRKLFFYSNDGEFEKYITFSSAVQEALPLDNGNFLIKGYEVTVPESKHIEWPLCLFNSKLEKIKELDKYFRLDEFKADTIEFPEPVLINSISNRKIYTGYGKRGYEIWVFDLDGNLMRKIRKEFQPVGIPEGVKEETRKATEDPRYVIYGKKIRFSKHWPPFQYLFTDDEGRLFVMTYEEGENPSEYMYDVFNSDGVFIDRMSLGNLVFESYWNIQYVTARKNRLYCLRRKDSGYRELVVYKMIWE